MYIINKMYYLILSLDWNSNFTTVVDMIVVKENCKKMLKYFNYNN